MTSSLVNSRRLWITATVIALMFLVIDSAYMLRGIRATSALSPSPTAPLEADARSPSGYAGNQHNVVVPYIGTDGYHWAMQTEQMLASGEARIRSVTYDGPASGRPVHWSSLLHWWAGGFAWLYSKLTGTPMAGAVEHVFPWVNTVFLALLIALMTPVIARRFGAISAAVFALGLVTIHPVYEFFSAGYFDHHGLASAAAMLCVLCAVAGGAGWIRDEEHALQNADGYSRSVWSWFVSADTAKRWFIASALAGAFGLWISAATLVPVIGAVGIGALVVAFLSRGTAWGAGWRIAPHLWRIWGIAGALASLAFYVIEYFPSHMTLRLEVNHPLYSLAWLGGGDLLFRLCTIAASRAGARGINTRHLSLIGADVLAIVVLPVVVLAVPESFILRPESFIIALHENYIEEFRGLGSQLAKWSWTQINAGIGLVPLLGLVPAVAVCFSKKVLPPVRALMVMALVPAVVSTFLSVRHVRWLGIGCALWLGVLVVIGTVATIGREVNAPWRSIKLVLAGAIVALVTSVVPVVLVHTRYVAASTAAEGSWTRTVNETASSTGPALGVIMAVIVVIAAVLPALGLSRGWTPERLVATGAFMGLIAFPFPTLAAYKWGLFDLSAPATSNDLTQVVVRDVAHRLRTRLGNERGVVASGPTNTTWLTYFGGMKGIGTLYWENVDGLLESAKLFGATSTATQSAADSAFAIVQRLGVTHIVLFSWGTFADEYAQLARGLGTHDFNSVSDATAQAFGPQLVAGQIPPWLRLIPYRLPPIPEREDAWAMILEVVPRQAPEEFAVRLAQYFLAIGDAQRAMQQINAALQVNPNNVAALTVRARIEYNNPQREHFAESVAQIRAAKPVLSNLALEDRIGLATVELLAGDTASARVGAASALEAANEMALRHLPPDFTMFQFLSMVRQFNLSAPRPEMLTLAYALLDPSLKAQLPPQGR